MTANPRPRGARAQPTLTSHAQQHCERGPGSDLRVVRDQADLKVGLCVREARLRRILGDPRQGLASQAVTKARVMWPMLGVPHCRIVNCNSARRISSTRSTPGWPKAASPQT